MPGANRTPDVEVLLRALAPLEALRHGVQHLNREIDRQAQLNEPTLGSLTWVAVRDPGPPRLVEACVMLTGAARKTGHRRVANPSGRSIEAVDLVELTAYWKMASLSKAHDAVVAFAPKFDIALGDSFKEAADQPTLGADLTFGISLMGADSEDVAAAAD
jgi:hypothetical protein